MLINAEKLVTYLRDEVHIGKLATVVEKWAKQNGFEIRIAKDGTVIIEMNNENAAINQ